MLNKWRKHGNYFAKKKKKKNIRNERSCNTTSHSIGTVSKKNLQQQQEKIAIKIAKKKNKRNTFEDNKHPNSINNL